MKEFREARRLRREGKIDEAQRVSKEAAEKFKFAEPKDLIFKNKYNFKKYETARRIKEQEDIEKLNDGRSYDSEEISRALPGISRRNVAERGINRRNRQGDRKVQSHVLKDVVEVTLTKKVQSEIEKAFPGISSFPKILEIKDGEVYRDLKVKGLEGIPMSSSVTIHSAEDYSGMRMFITEDGHTGITLTEDGHLGGAFSSPKSGRKADLDYKNNIVWFRD